MLLSLIGPEERIHVPKAVPDPLYSGSNCSDTRIISWQSITPSLCKTVD